LLAGISEKRVVEAGNDFRATTIASGDKNSKRKSGNGMT
jgi:hypothetical protein